jgi:uncharacterized protein YdiU (UPF0061 family)
VRAVPPDAGVGVAQLPLQPSIATWNASSVVSTLAEIVDLELESVDLSAEQNPDHFEPNTGLRMLQHLQDAMPVT